MASLNKVMLIGNLTKDPEIRYMPGGDAVCNFSIATNERFKDKSGQQQERVEYHNIVIYRKLAEIAGEYLKKGSAVYLEGKLQTRKWQDKTTGADRYSTEILVGAMQMLGGKSGAVYLDKQAEAPTEQAKSIESSSAEAVPFADDIPF